MARQARIIVPNHLHHISQRGNRNDFIFFEKADFQTYLDIMIEQFKTAKTNVYAYCLMPNQVHWLLEPTDSKDTKLMGRMIGEGHRRYTAYINAKKNWQGHLFQSRFFSYAADEKTALDAARFMENLPVIMKISPTPQNYIWSSAKAHSRQDIASSFLSPFRSFHAVQNWEEYLNRPVTKEEIDQIQLHLQTGRPRGSELFLDKVEAYIGYGVRPKKRGRKPKQASQAA